METKETESYELLKTKAIYAILDGDTSFGEYTFDDGSSIPVSMPYLSGPDLCGISTQFGLPVAYSRGGSNLSRWQYMDNLFDFFCKNRRCFDLLSYFFRKDQFSKLLSGHGANKIESAYNSIIQKSIEG